MLNIWGFVKCVFILKLLAKFSGDFHCYIYTARKPVPVSPVAKMMVTGYKQQGMEQNPIEFFFKSYTVLVYRLNLFSAFDEYVCTIFLLIQYKNV